MVFVPIKVVKAYMENKWGSEGGRPEKKSDRDQEILLQWFVWLGYYPEDYRALMNLNSQLTTYYRGSFRFEVRALPEGIVTRYTEMP